MKPHGCYHPHFSDEETEVPREEVGWKVRDLHGLQSLGLSTPGACALSPCVAQHRVTIITLLHFVSNQVLRLKPFQHFNSSY